MVEKPADVSRDNGSINNKISDFVGSMLSAIETSGYSSEEFNKALIEGIFDLGMIGTWYRNPKRSQGWLLKGGILSPDYINLRSICSYRESHKILPLVGKAFSNLITENTPYVNKTLSVALAGVPLGVVTVVMANGRYPMCMTRPLPGVKNMEDFSKMLETHGDRALVEGEIYNGDRFGIIDDVISSAVSKRIAKGQLEYQIKEKEKEVGELDVTCDDVFVIIDREQKGRETLEKIGMNLYSIVTMSQCLEWLKDKMAPIEYEVLKEYHRDDRKYQDPDYRRELEQVAIKESTYFAPRTLV